MHRLNTYKPPPLKASLSRVLRDVCTSLLDKLDRIMTKIYVIDAILPQDHVRPTRENRLRTKRSPKPFLLPVLHYLLIKEHTDLIQNNTALKQNYTTKTETLKDLQNEHNLLLDAYQRNLDKLKQLQDIPTLPDVDTFISTAFTNLRNLSIIPNRGEGLRGKRVRGKRDLGSDLKIIIPNLIQTYSTGHVLAKLIQPLAAFQSPIIAADQLYNELSDILDDNKIDSSNNNNLAREKRFIGAALSIVGAISGILGTFMGMYTAAELEKLKDSISDLQGDTKLLFQINNEQDIRIKEIVDDLTRVGSVVDALLQNNPTVLYARLENQISLLAERMDQTLDTIQQLQHRRLSVNFLTGPQLHTMHEELVKMASVKNLNLLPDKISDYFQLEASYLRQGLDIMVLVHVPCVHTHHILKLSLPLSSSSSNSYKST